MRNERLHFAVHKVLERIRRSRANVVCTQTVRCNMSMTPCGEKEGKSINRLVSHFDTKTEPCLQQHQSASAQHTHTDTPSTTIMLACQPRVLASRIAGSKFWYHLCVRSGTRRSKEARVRGRWAGRSVGPQTPHPDEAARQTKGEDRERARKEECEGQGLFPISVS